METRPYDAKLGTTTAADRMPEVAAQVQELRYEAEEMEKLAAQIEARFDRVLGSAPQQAAGVDAQPGNPNMTALGSELADIRACHRRAIETLRGVLNRAEL